MGGNSTLHSAVLGDTQHASSTSFDLQSWQGLTQILSVARDTLHDPQAYAEFRNLVLEYAQKGGDHELRQKIDAVIKTFGSDVRIEEEVHTPTPMERTLKVESSSHSTTEEVHEKQDVLHEKPKDQVRTLTSNGTRRIQPRFSPHTVTHDEVVIEAKIPEAVSRVVPDPLPSFIPQEPAHAIVEEVPVPVMRHEEVAAPAFKSVEEHKQRIAEIKRAVHEHIGNPAALLDSYGALGRTYMTALLAALKATGAGSEEGIGEAMQRLESAYTALIAEPKKDSVSTMSTPSITPSTPSEETEIFDTVEPEPLQAENVFQSSTTFEPAPLDEPVPTLVEEEVAQSIVPTVPPKKIFSRKPTRIVC